MRPQLLFPIVLLLSSSAAIFQAQAQDDSPIQREVLGLRLGQNIKRLKKSYPSLESCSSKMELKGRVNRIRLDKTCAEDLPKHVEILWLGLVDGRLQEVQIVYDAAYAHEKPLEALVGDIELIYGEPRHTSNKFWWADGKTVMRAFYAEVPEQGIGGKGVSLRVSLQLLDAGLFEAVAPQGR